MVNQIFIIGSASTDSLSFFQNYLKEKAYIISVDGGANILFQLKNLPDIAIGDFDSISNEANLWLQNNKVERITYPCEKDFSDFELTSQRIIQTFTPIPIHLFGMIGGRSDHFLFNLKVATNLFNQGFNPIFHSSKEDIFFVNSKHPIHINDHVGDTVSLIPIKNSVLIHQTKGLKYNLWDEELSEHSTRGLSNLITQESMEVKVSEGIVLLIITRNT